MKLDDSLTGGGFVLLGLAMIALSRGMEPVAHIPYGPGFFPTIIGAIMVGFGGLLVLRRVGAGRGRLEGLARLPPASGTRRDWLTPVLFVAAPLLYIVLAPAVGFLIVMPCILLMLMGHLSGRWMTALVLSVLLSVGLHGLFEGIMRVPLPWGVLEPWAGVLSWR